MTNVMLQAAVPAVDVKQPKPRRPDGDLVQSLMRALTLLELLAEGGCRLKELSQRSNLPPSTAHRLLTTLEQRRFVRFDRDENLWTIGTHCQALGTGQARRQDFLSGAAAGIDRLASRIGATVNLGVMESGSLLLVGQSSGARQSPAQSPAQSTGTRLPMHATAMGKVLLAGAEEDKRSGSLLTKGLNRLTERTICDPSELARELRAIRIEGLAVDNEESMAGRRCIAAPVRNSVGKCVAAVSVTATRSQLTDAAVARLSGILAAAALEIGRDIACA